MLSLLLWLAHSTVSWAKPVHVLYVPAGQTGYWHDTTVPMPTVAQRLGIKLTIFPSHPRLRSYADSLNKALSANPKPDWVIWAQRRVSNVPTLETLKKHAIKSIDITSGTSSKEQATIGFPQQNYPNWKAQILSDEFLAGKKIAIELIERKRQINSKNALTLAAIAGTRMTYAAQQTIAGLNDAFTYKPNNARLLQTVFTTWHRDLSKQTAQKLLSRHNQIDLFWAANPNIALGIIDHLNTQNWQTHSKPLVANFGLNPQSRQAIIQDELAFSMVGNHLNGVWALILIHDIEHGVTFNNTPAQTILKAPYFLADKNNLKFVDAMMSADFWQKAKIKQYSKYYNPNIKNYNFDVSLLQTSTSQ